MAKRILIIDDDTYIRELYQEILTSEGYEVTTAKDGEEGLKHLLEGGFAVVLLDVMMPKLDGVGVLTKLKESTPTEPNGPILLLTNLDHDPALDQAMSLGAHSHLLKADMLPPVLVQHIKSLLT
jgi:CheY-like chemotaxis protein